MTADKTAVPEWIDVAFADGFGWSTYAAHEGDKTRFIRSDLCASGQVQAVMDAADRDADRCAERITELEAALEKARAEAKRMDLARDQFLGERNMLAEALREIQRGDMTGMMELTEAEAARTRATWAIKRIGTPVAALTPAPQAATPTAQEAVPVADGSLICCPRCGCFHERGACGVWGCGEGEAGDQLYAALADNSGCGCLSGRQRNDAARPRTASEDPWQQAPLRPADAGRICIRPAG